MPEMHQITNTIIIIIIIILFFKEKLTNAAMYGVPGYSR